jgi:hypothetical protein
MYLVLQGTPQLRKHLVLVITIIITLASGEFKTN